MLDCGLRLKSLAISATLLSNLRSPNFTAPKSLLIQLGIDAFCIALKVHLFPKVQVNTLYIQNLWVMLSPKGEGVQTGYIVDRCAETWWTLGGIRTRYCAC